MKFFDRTEQLAQLREMKNRSYENHSMLTVVTGRRRIGKTTLIDKSMSGEEYLYFFVGKKNEAVLCAEFSGEIRAKLGLFVPDGITSFKDMSFKTSARSILPYSPTFRIIGINSV